MNKLGQETCPFLFLIDFDLEKNIVLKLSNIDADILKWDFTGSYIINETISYKPLKIPFSEYEKAFSEVKNHLNIGNSFLLNLTASTPLETKNSLLNFYNASKAKFKVYLKDHFTCFSPEPFVSINAEGIISSFPMKGTISASKPNAKELILQNLKETYEHTTIVDLIRNDLSKICNKIWVEKFRYFDSIRKDDGEMLFQVSSEIKGILPKDWQQNLGTLLFELLPAGSISGAPKVKTLEIIKKAESLLHENGERNFYTGIGGIFDGSELVSTVMIRFIEQKADGSLVFKTGGGITANSVLEEEYFELNQKIYVPVF